MYIVQRVSKENYILKVNISKISKAVKAGFWGGEMFRCLPYMQVWVHTQTILELGEMNYTAELLSKSNPTQLV